MKIKKILSVAALAGVGAVALASCGKKYKGNSNFYSI